ncbi:unnamed protein product [Amoebophrya sp. A120]|nr:unnamed protein product [Amoebophrya sp. A120]|eukprot:GSA120T00007315001.1
MIDYTEEWFFPLLFRWDGSVGLRALYFSLPSCCLALILLILEDENFYDRETLKLDTLTGSAIWSSVSAVLLMLIQFRTSRGIARFWEGTGLMHMMRAEWFDTVSNCISFSIHAKQKSPVMHWRVVKFRHTLVRLMSLLHGFALEEMSGNCIDVLTLDKSSLGKPFLKYINELSSTYKFNKVEMVLHLMQSLIITAHHAQLLDVPSPILSRVFQTISRGFVHFLNTKKITNTKFPFPYVQLIIVSLYAYSVLSPIVITSMVKNKVLACILVFFPLWILAALNHISIELENPFGDDDNDLPLEHFQDDMDRTMCMLLHPRSDMIPLLDDSCLCDVDEMMVKFGMRVQKKSSKKLGNVVSNFSYMSFFNAKNGQTLQGSAEDTSGISPRGGSTSKTTSSEGGGEHGDHIVGLDGQILDEQIIAIGDAASGDHHHAHPEVEIIGQRIEDHSTMLTKRTRHGLSMSDTPSGPVRAVRRRDSSAAGDGEQVVGSSAANLSTLAHQGSKARSSSQDLLQEEMSSSGGEVDPVDHAIQSTRAAGGHQKERRPTVSFDDNEDISNIKRPLGASASSNGEEGDDVTVFEEFETHGCLRPREGIDRFRKHRSKSQKFRLANEKRTMFQKLARKAQVITTHLAGRGGGSNTSHSTSNSGRPAASTMSLASSNYQRKTGGDHDAHNSLSSAGP